MTDAKPKPNYLQWILVAGLIYLFFTRQAPVPTPGPVDPVAPTKVDTQLIEGSRVAAKALVDAMAADMAAMSKDVADGVSKTVSDIALANAKRDTDSRDVFKKTMAELLKPRLGDGDLKPGSESVFRDVASGFRKAVK